MTNRFYLICIGIYSFFQYCCIVKHWWILWLIDTISFLIIKHAVFAYYFFFVLSGNATISIIFFHIEQGGNKGILRFPEFLNCPFYFIYLCPVHVIFNVLKLSSNLECLFSFNFQLKKKLRSNFAFWDTFKLLRCLNSKEIKLQSSIRVIFTSFRSDFFLQLKDSKFNNHFNIWCWFQHFE